MGTTRQRQAIHKILIDSSIHLTADQILAEARLIFPNIGKATVYRNLNLMADEGIFRRVHLPDKPVMYDANVIPHQHKVCVHCGSIEDIDVIKAEEINRLVNNEKIVDYNLVVYSVCKKCDDKGKTL